MKTTDIIAVAVFVVLAVHSDLANGQSDRMVMLDADSTQQLSLPAVSAGDPAAGKRVIVTPPEYEGTEVYHSLYLPKSWTPDWNKTGTRLPIIFEYTGNYFPRAGSTGEVEDAGLGYGLSGGKYIWVSLPYVSADGKDNEVRWWGDEEKTIQYAKTNVPRIIERFGGDPNAVFLCGFSRGAIAVNYIGLHDDEISSLWTSFITHDHFDGAKGWPTTWGKPLDKYREGAAERLKRVGSRPYLVSQNGNNPTSETFIRSVLPSVDNFNFSYVDTGAIFGEFPNALAKAGHTDRWPLKASKFRAVTWQWMNNVTEHRFGSTPDLN